MDFSIDKSKKGQDMTLERKIEILEKYQDHIKSLGNETEDSEEKIFKQGQWTGLDFAINILKNDLDAEVWASRFEREGETGGTSS